jgi:hypothetical protein
METMRKILPPNGNTAGLPRDQEATMRLAHQILAGLVVVLAAVSPAAAQERSIEQAHTTDGNLMVGLGVAGAEAMRLARQHLPPRVPRPTQLQWGTPFAAPAAGVHPELLTRSSRGSRHTGEVLMLVGGAGIVVGVLTDESVITIAGAGVGGYGLYLYLR